MNKNSNYNKMEINAGRVEFDVAANVFCVV